MDLWVKVNPHKSPFPINRPCRAIMVNLLLGARKNSFFLLKLYLSKIVLTYIWWSIQARRSGTAKKRHKITLKIPRLHNCWAINQFLNEWSRDLRIRQFCGRCRLSPFSHIRKPSRFAPRVECKRSATEKARENLLLFVFSMLQRLFWFLQLLPPLVKILSTVATGK